MTPEEKLDVTCMMYLAALGFKPDHVREIPELMEETRRFVRSQMDKPNIVTEIFTITEIDEPQEPDSCCGT